MTHFAVIAPPLRGHYRPLSILAEELIRRGHRVTFVHQEDARSLVDAEGAKFHAIGGGAPPVERWTRPMAKIKGLLGLGGVMRRMRQFTTLFCEEGPAALRVLEVDVVICDQLEPGGALAAEHLGLPWISVATTLPMNREAGVPPPFVNWPYDASEKGVKRNQGGWRVSDLLLRGFNKTIGANASSLGLSAKRRMEDCFSPLLQVAQIVPGLDYPRRELPAAFHYTGPFKRDEMEAFELPPSDAPIVYCTLGTLQGSRLRLLAKIASACDKQGLRLVITLGHLGDRRAVEKLPGKPLVYDWVPQDALLRQADLVICHGGMNSVLDVLAAGLPMLVLPLAFEQPGIAARVQHSGAGLMLKPSASITAIGDALQRLRTDGSFKNRAAALAREINRSGGARLAADLIEQALGTAAPPAAATTADAAPDDVRDDSRSGSRSAATRSN